MSFGGANLIGEIEAELKFEYLPGAIRWADQNFDGAWSKAIDRYDNALSLAIERKDWRSLQIEGAHYKRTVLDMIVKYKRHKNMTDSESFLSSLRFV